MTSIPTAGHLHAWLLVHMLQLGHLAGLPAFHTGVRQLLELIDAGEPAATAVEKALGVDVASLQRLLKTYRRRRSLPTQTLAVHIEPEPPPIVDCLAPRDAAYMLASQVAHERAPWMPRVNLFLGEAYRYIGDKDRARAHLSQAMHWHFSKRWRDRAASSLSQLDSPQSD